jgi:hypothetical protein
LEADEARKLSLARGQTALVVSLPDARSETPGRILREAGIGNLGALWVASLSDDGGPAPP